MIERTVDDGSMMAPRGKPAAGSKAALITGVTGQNDAYLARLPIDKGYVVHGIKRRSSSFNTGRITVNYREAYGLHASAGIFRPAEGDTLLGDSTKAREMVLADMALLDGTWPAACAAAAITISSIAASAIAHAPALVS